MSARIKTKKAKARTPRQQRDALAAAILDLISHGYAIHDAERDDGSCPGCAIDAVLKEMGRFV